MRLYVGNLPFGTDENRLNEVFGAYGAVKDARVMRDRETQRSRGFGFVEMESPQDGNQAVEGLNGKELDGRRLVVNEARPRQEGGDFGGGGGGGGRGRGGGGGGRGRY